ncbi:MAG: hypothetical protein J6T92_04430 [Ottowia sp.]|nr:hypothetical protein [Ottowia sp.]
MNAVKVVAMLAQQDADKARSEGQAALREEMLAWLTYLHKRAAESADEGRRVLFTELATQAPHMEHVAAVRVVDFIYAYQANTRYVLGLLRQVIEGVKCDGKPSEVAEGSEP